MARNYWSEIVVFWRNVVNGRGLAAAVRVHHSAPGLTQVRITDRLPRSPFRPGPPHWMVTTRPQRLRTTHFHDSAPRERVTRAAHKPRGRAVYCVTTPEGQVWAGVSFHLDPARNVPVLVTAVALRTDGDADVAALSRMCAGWLLAYLHEVGTQDGRPPGLCYEAKSEAELQEMAGLGFRLATPPAGFSPLGRFYLEAPPV